MTKSQQTHRVRIVRVAPADSVPSPLRLAGAITAAAVVLALVLAASLPVRANGWDAAKHNLTGSDAETPTH